jgi:hypothetical protein
MALLPSISSKMFKGVRRDPYDEWQNSGYGLFGVSRLCGLGGKFFICSGKTGLTLKPNERKYHATDFKGTALRLNLCSKDIKQLNTILARIKKEGDKIAKMINKEAHTPASVASRMLVSDFEES